MYTEQRAWRIYNSASRIFAFIVLHVTSFTMSKKEPSKLSQYVDPSGDFSTSEFKLGYWYVTHKLLLRRILIGILTAWSVVTIGIGLVVWGQYLFVGYWDDEDLLSAHLTSFQNYAAVQPAYEAQTLAFDRSAVFQSADGRYDFYTPVTNPNDDFIAYVDFRYVAAQDETALATATILPRATQSLTLYGHPTPTYPSQARLIVEDVRWQRVNPNAIPDAAAFMQPRLAFRVSDFTFTRPNSGEGNLSTRIAFQLTNDSVYSYWEPVFQVLLQRGNTTVGVLPLSVEEFRAKEVRDIEIYTFAELTQVDSIEVVPLVNVFDSNTYIAVGE